MHLVSEVEEDAIRRLRPDEDDESFGTQREHRSRSDENRNDRSFLACLH